MTFLTANISPVDLSFLNAAEKPAGKHGTLGVAGDQLVFADGTPARFWGANLTAYALFNTGLSDTVNQAKRLSKLGFNLVRIHSFRFGLGEAQHSWHRNCGGP